MKNVSSLLVVLLLVSVACASQNNESNNARASEAIDKLYQQFRESYATLDVDLVTSLYSPDAHYLTGNPDQATMTDRIPIRESFANYFEWAENNDMDLRISFRIIKREIDDSLAFDVGYYLIQSKKRAAEVFPEDGGVGKFVTTMKLQEDGNSWKFMVDGFSPAPYQAFFSDSSAHDPAPGL